MTHPTRQTVRVYQYGGLDQLKRETIPCPQPQTGEVLIRIHATGVLPADWKMRQGYFHSYNPQTFPYIPGSAISGIVVDVGPDVSGYQNGDAVFGRSNNGAYTDYTTAAIDTLAHKPAALSFDEAATISGGAVTAWTALFDNGNLQAGQRVLIHGAAGGVGNFAVQFARWQGAHVSATTSTGNVDFVRSLGAETVIDYTTTPFEQVVHDVDLVLDAVGGEMLARSWSVVKRGGTLVSIAAQPSAEKAQELGVRAIFGGGLPTSKLLQTIGSLISDGHVKATVYRTFPLSQARQAQELSQTGHGRGRIVLRMVD